MRLIAPFALFALLAACGADGMPTPPGGGSTPPGVTGQLRIGVSG